MELASTLATNATKPNPFEITALQTTGKENNWKTKETLARGAVTLETERIKESNPWCLWWWCYHHLCNSLVCMCVCGNSVYTYTEYAVSLILCYATLRYTNPYTVCSSHYCVLQDRNKTCQRRGFCLSNCQHNCTIQLNVNMKCDFRLRPRSAKEVCSGLLYSK